MRFRGVLARRYFASLHRCEYFFLSARRHEIFTRNIFCFHGACVSPPLQCMRFFPRVRTRMGTQRSRRSCPPPPPPIHRRDADARIKFKPVDEQASPHGPRTARHAQKSSLARTWDALQTEALLGDARHADLGMTETDQHGPNAMAPRRRFHRAYAQAKPCGATHQLRRGAEEA